MDSALIRSLSLEVITEILSLLDYQYKENAFGTCQILYRARPFVIFPAIEKQTAWLRSCENSAEIPRSKLDSHNAFLRIVNQTFTVTRPIQLELDSLVTLFTRELIS